MSENYIFFYGHGKTNPRGFLSNFYVSSFTADSLVFNTVEKYMHYHKALLFKDDDIAKVILASEVPRDAKKLGRKIKNFDHRLWNAHKYNIVKEGIRLKFSSNIILKKLLLDTSPKILVEAAGKGFMRSPDPIWGIALNAPEAIEIVDSGASIDFYGENLLGCALMEVREDFLREKS